MNRAEVESLAHQMATYLAQVLNWGQGAVLGGLKLVSFQPDFSARMVMGEIELVSQEGMSSKVLVFVRGARIPPHQHSLKTSILWGLNGSGFTVSFYSTLPNTLDTGRWQPFVAHPCENPGSFVKIPATTIYSFDFGPFDKAPKILSGAIEFSAVLETSIPEDGDDVDWVPGTEPVVVFEDQTVSSCIAN